MIIIGEPKIIKSDSKVRLSCPIEMNNEIKDLWLEVDKKYGKYLVKDRCDAFLAAMLPIAMRNKKDIICNSPVSEELLHNITVQLIPSVAKHSRALYKTRISAEIEKHPVKNAGGVGTDLSRGIESMHVLSKYLDTDFSHLKLTHVCVYDVGVFSIASFNEKGQGERVKRECMAQSLKLAEKLNIPAIVVKSNLADDFNIQYALNPNYCSLFPVLALQKLWKVYFYASTYDFSCFTLKNNDRYNSSFYDLLLVNTLSTSNLKIYSEGGEKNNLDKLGDIVDFEPALSNLHVCSTDSKNCNKCIKCMRTLLSLDALDKLDNFRRVFDVDYYKHHRRRYVEFLEKWYEENEKINEPVYEIFRKRGMLSCSPAVSHVASLKLPPVSTTSLIIKNLSTEKVLLEKQPKEFCSAVGFSKIMTAIIALESGNTQMYVDLPPNFLNGLEKATLYDLINVLLITQDNTAANLIAETVGGTVEDFVELMNNKSKQIRAWNTNYTLPTGLGAESRTTAEDAVKLIEYTIHNMHFCEIFKRKSYTIRYDGHEKTVQTLNPLLRPGSRDYIPESLASKYGLCGSYGNICTVSQLGNDIYLAILMGVKEDKNTMNRYKDTKNLMDAVLKKAADKVRT